MDQKLHILDDIYDKFNKRDLVTPDPLQFLYNYQNPIDIEIVGLIASSLAYGRVQQILKAITTVLDLIGESPVEFVQSTSKIDMLKLFGGFKYRFTTGTDISLMLFGIKRLLNDYGSIESAFLNGYSAEDENLLPAMSSFVEKIVRDFPDGKTYLLPSPNKGSACKRFNLFLRWMVRSDQVDPGGWNTIPTSKLLIPLDTHMNNICTSTGITKRKNADLKAVIEITEWFKAVNANDPIKYDFALTRFGIRDDMNIEDLLKSIIDNNNGDK